MKVAQDGKPERRLHAIEACACVGICVVMATSLPAWAQGITGDIQPPPRPFDLGNQLLQSAPVFLMPPSSGTLVLAPEPPQRGRDGPAVDIALVPGATQQPVATLFSLPPQPDIAQPVVPGTSESANAPPAPSTAPPSADSFASRLRGWLQSPRQPEEEDDEWPRRTPGQQGLPDPEPAYDPNEKPDVPGLSTDPGVSTKCLPQVLQAVLQKVVTRYGAVKVTSTYRPIWRARRGSYHRRCEAVDFRVPGIRPGEVLALVKTYEETGGHKVYWNGLIHVDTGPYRTWLGSRR